MRKERDILGERDIKADALYGIHSLRASENFPCNIAFNQEWYRAVGITKVACYRTYRKFYNATVSGYGNNHRVPFMDMKILDALEKAAMEVSDGKWFSHFIVPAVQGGAGTSINMNVNEIITNRALILLGESPGSYSHIDPIDNANIYQSTNDTIPTALTVAAMRLLYRLEKTINALRQSIEAHEKQTRDLLRPAYTQMQEAVPSSFGVLLSTYNEALSRDWWRVSKCLERIKVVNLGGGATGTGLAIPRYFMMEVVPTLREITTLPLTRAENLADATANMDIWTEVHATLKAQAVNLEKIASDIRLMASDISGKGYMTIPARQAGSSVMPGKVNPVIPEFVISVANRVYANDMLISSMAGQGCLDLNAYLPVIGDAMLNTLELLIAAGESFRKNLTDGMVINRDASYSAMLGSYTTTTALIPVIGYNNASKIAAYMKETRCDIYHAIEKTGLMPVDEAKRLLAPENLLKMGFTISDLNNTNKL
ncbi:MAG: hypothetical protein KFF49_12965 [Bacteroidales bacterium]|nr:hypothetical protein [Bacteroidales bacterium]